MSFFIRFIGNLFKERCVRSVKSIPTDSPSLQVCIPTLFLCHIADFCSSVRFFTVYLFLWIQICFSVCPLIIHIFCKFAFFLINRVVRFYIDSFSERLNVIFDPSLAVKILNDPPRPNVPSQKAWLEIASDNHARIFPTLLPQPVFINSGINN